MLQLSIKSRYGLSAVLELACNFGNRLTQAKDIVSKHNVPGPYLEQLLNRLCKAGLVKSVRGKKGGYKLSAHPSGITLLSVLETLEGGVSFGKIDNLCSVQEICSQIETEIKAKLNVSLDELARRESESKNCEMFYI